MTRTNRFANALRIACSALALGATLAACSGEDGGSKSSRKDKGEKAATTMAFQTKAPVTMQTGPVNLNKPLPPGVTILQRTAIQDLGAIRNGTAATIYIPNGWTAQGGVQMPQVTGCNGMYEMNWTAQSADGKSNFMLVKDEVWMASNWPVQGPCRNVQYTSLKDHLADRVQRAIPGARVIDYRERADFKKAAEAYVEITNGAARSSGSTDWLSAYPEGGEILFAFQKDGVEMRGVMGASAKVVRTTAPSTTVGQIWNISGQTMGAYVAMAPDGQLDFRMVEAMRKSMTPDGEWLQTLGDLIVQKGAGDVRNTATVAQMMVAGGATATAQNIATYKAMAKATAANGMPLVANNPNSGLVNTVSSNEDTDARIHRRNIEAIQGVNTYYDPVGEKIVQQDATFDGGWRINNHDAYILTNNVNFNPAEYGLEATQMQRIQ